MNHTNRKESSEVIHTGVRNVDKIPANMDK